VLDQTTGTVDNLLGNVGDLLFSILRSDDGGANYIPIADGVKCTTNPCSYTDNTVRHGRPYLYQVIPNLAGELLSDALGLTGTVLAGVTGTFDGTNVGLLGPILKDVTSLIVGTGCSDATDYTTCDNKTSSPINISSLLSLGQGLSLTHDLSTNNLLGGSIIDGVLVGVGTVLNGVLGTVGALVGNVAGGLLGILEGLLGSAPTSMNYYFLNSAGKLLDFTTVYLPLGTNPNSDYLLLDKPVYSGSSGSLMLSWEGAIVCDSQGEIVPLVSNVIPKNAGGSGVEYRIYKASGDGCVPTVIGEGTFNAVPEKEVVRIPQGVTAAEQLGSEGAFTYVSGKAADNASCTYIGSTKTAYYTVSGLVRGDNATYYVVEAVLAGNGYNGETFGKTEQAQYGLSLIVGDLVGAVGGLVNGVVGGVLQLVGSVVDPVLQLVVPVVEGATQLRILGSVTKEVSFLGTGIGKETKTETQEALIPLSLLGGVTNILTHNIKEGTLTSDIGGAVLGNLLATVGGLLNGLLGGVLNVLGGLLTGETILSNTLTYQLINQAGGITTVLDEIVVPVAVK
jgi:hypothetical protein